MTCPVFFNVVCSALHDVGSTVVGTVTSGFLDQLADGIRDGITWIFTNSVDFWVRQKSPNLSNQSAISALQHWMLPITAAVAAAGMIAAGLRMVLTRRANPLLDLGTGLVTIAAVSTLGVIVPNLLLKAGDAWSNWALESSTGGAFSTRLSELLLFTGDPASITVVLGTAGILIGAIQAVLMLFRQAAIVILIGVLPMAAAGSIAPLTRSWIRKIVSWLLALIFYKPAAAAVYAAAFTMIGNGKGLQTILSGFVMLILSLVALPVLMRFFTWTTGTIASGGGGQFIGAAASGAVAMGALRGSSGGAGGASASEHASYLSSAQPPPPAADGARGAAADSGQAAAGTGQPAGSSPNGSPAAGAAASGAGGPGGGAAGEATSAAGSAGGAAAGQAAAGAASAATGGVAGAVLVAGQGLAKGARNAAASATGEGDAS
jgi:hypothetical protein